MRWALDDVTILSLRRSNILPGAVRSRYPLYGRADHTCFWHEPPLAKLDRSPRQGGGLMGHWYQNRVRLLSFYFIPSPHQVELSPQTFCGKTPCSPRVKQCGCSKPAVGSALVHLITCYVTSPWHPTEVVPHRAAPAVAAASARGLARRLVRRLCALLVHRLVHGHSHLPLPPASPPAPPASPRRSSRPPATAQPLLDASFVGRATYKPDS